MQSTPSLPEQQSQSQFSRSFSITHQIRARFRFASLQEVDCTLVSGSLRRITEHGRGRGGDQAEGELLQFRFAIESIVAALDRSLIAFSKRSLWVRFGTLVPNAKWNADQSSPSAVVLVCGCCALLLFCSWSVSVWAGGRAGPPFPPRPCRPSLTSLEQPPRAGRVHSSK
jgi:hypothetical protein